MATKLKTEKLLPSDSIERICKELVCDYYDKGCMYGKCTTCAKSTADKAVHDKNLLCSWMQWRTIKERREIKKDGKLQEKFVSITKK